MSPLARVQNTFQKRQVKAIEGRIPGSLLIKAKI